MMTRNRRRRQRGFTLVEMMIALMLFTFAVAGVLSVAVTMASGFREQRQVIATEGAVRGPMDFLTDAVRMASPAVPTGNIQDTITCTTVPVGSSGVGGLSVINSAAGPDVLDITYASGAVVSSLRTIYDAGTTTFTINNEDNQAGQIGVGDTLLISNLTQGHIVHVTNVTPAGLTADITVTAQCGTVAIPAGGYLPGSFVIRVVRARFSIAKDLSNITVTDPLGVPSLFMDADADGIVIAAPGEPLAEGIEDMQIAFAIDADNDGTINPATEWFSGPAMPLAGLIRAVRITLVARSMSPLPGAGTTSLPYTVEDHPAGPGDAFRRRILTSTIEVRNLQGSP